jgi:hypothetical protein
MPWRVEESIDGSAESRIRLISPDGFVFEAAFPTVEIDDQRVVSEDHKRALLDVQMLVQGKVRIPFVGNVE